MKIAYQQQLEKGVLKSLELASQIASYTNDGVVEVGRNHLCWTKFSRFCRHQNTCRNEKREKVKSIQIIILLWILQTTAPASPIKDKNLWEQLPGKRARHTLEMTAADYHPSISWYTLNAYHSWTQRNYTSHQFLLLEPYTPNRKKICGQTHTSR